MGRRLRRRDAGFTLVEIMIALAIIGLVAIVLLDRRVECVRAAQKIRDQRLAWTLAAWKMSAIELDDELFRGDRDSSDAGKFQDYAEDYAGYAWEYDAKREEIKTNDEKDPEDKPRTVYRVTLRVRRGEEPEPLIALEGVFAVREKKEEGAETPAPEGPPK
jgi:type II secretion system protein I